MPRSVMRRKALFSLIACISVLFIGIQLIPIGRNHENLPRRVEPAWDSLRTRELARRACFDCHSNETRWPWYSHVAPASWLIQEDVEEGRRHLNFSEWDRAGDEAGEVREELLEREMPPWFYLPLHAEARLTEAERLELARGLMASLESGSERSREHDDHDD